MNNYYVYAHVCPITNEIVYIGKGIHGRAWDVTRARKQNSGHCDWMKDLYHRGYLPTAWVEISYEGLAESAAFAKEKELIQLFSPKFNIGQSGERNYQAKLTDEQARTIFQSSKLHRELAQEYGVSRSAISMIKTRKQWRAATACCIQN